MEWIIVFLGQIRDGIYFDCFRIIKVKLTIEPIRVKTFCESIFVLEACGAFHHTLILRSFLSAPSHVWTVFSYYCEPWFTHGFIHMLWIPAYRVTAHNLFCMSLHWQPLSECSILLWNWSNSWLFIIPRRSKLWFYLNQFIIDREQEAADSIFNKALRIIFSNLT